MKTVDIKILMLMFTFTFILQEIGCKKAEPIYIQAVSKDNTILNALKNNEDYSMFLHALQRAQLDSLLDQEGPFTVLVPDNMAFQHAQITESQLNALDLTNLKAWMASHIIPNLVLPYEDVPLGLHATYNNLEGNTLFVSKKLADAYTGKRLVFLFNGVPVRTMDIEERNGLIQVLTNPLKFQYASVKDLLQADTTFSYYAQALNQFGLLNQLDQVGPFTLLAPTNEAFRQSGINRDSLAKLDSLHFKKFLFSSSILKPLFTFSQEFVSFNSNTNPDGIGLFVFPDYTVSQSTVYLSDEEIYMPTFSIRSPNTHMSSTGELEYYYYGPGTTIVNADNTAKNGVVHGLDKILVYPDSVRINK